MKNWWSLVTDILYGFNTRWTFTKPMLPKEKKKKFLEIATKL